MDNEYIISFMIILLLLVMSIKKQAVPAPKSRAKLDLHPFSRMKFRANSYTIKK